MKRTILLILAGVAMLSAQPRHTANFHQNTLPKPRAVLVDPNDRVFPDVLAGGGWETVITFVNMSNSTAQFTLDFYDDNDNLITMPLQNADGSVSRFASSNFSLAPNTSSELVVADVDNSANSAWGYVSFTSAGGAVAGMAVVRSKDSQGTVINESTYTLSNIQDFDFYAPYDNLEGVSTGIILVNSASSQSANIRISAQNPDGSEILRDQFLLPAGGRREIVLQNAYPALAQTSGKLRVTSDTNRLSAICFRVSPSGSTAYSPIFNWSGMFQ